MNRLLAWLFPDPPSPLPARLQRPWTEAQCLMVYLHMMKVMEKI